MFKITRNHEFKDIISLKVVRLIKGGIDNDLQKITGECHIQKGDIHKRREWR